MTIFPSISFDNVDFWRLTHNLAIKKKKGLGIHEVKSHVAKNSGKFFGEMAFQIHSYKKCTLYM